MTACEGFYAHWPSNGNSAQALLLAYCIWGFQNKVWLSWVRVSCYLIYIVPMPMCLQIRYNGKFADQKIIDLNRAKWRDVKVHHALGNMPFTMVYDSVKICKTLWPEHKRVTVRVKWREWSHDDTMTWKCFLHYWPFEWGNQCWLVYSLHKGTYIRSFVKFFVI